MVCRRSGTLSSDSASRGQLATGRAAGTLPTRISARGYRQAVDLISPGDGNGPGEGGHAQPQYGVASLVLQQELTAIVAALPPLISVPDAAANRAAWAHWQEGLSVRFTLLETLPPLRLLLILDNLAGHKSAAFVCWLMAHGVLPLYTPLSGRWLNMAESVQRILIDRALAGQHPDSSGFVNK